jgi:hypothetical protein
MSGLKLWKEKRKKVIRINQRNKKIQKLKIMMRRCIKDLSWSLIW